MSNTDASGEKRVTGTSERREQIIQRLRQQGSVQVNDLSALYGVSTVTIRNDLAFLEKQGIAVSAYGGALICDSTNAVSRNLFTVIRLSNRCKITTSICCFLV